MTTAREGKLHDKRFHDEDDIIGGIPDEVPVLLDSGFQGVQKQYVNIELPHKRPKGGELTPLQKEQNKSLSSRRVVCENAFAGVKRYNAVATIYLGISIWRLLKMISITGLHCLLEIDRYFATDLMLLS